MREEALLVEGGQTLTIQLPDRSHARLQALAARTGQTETDLMGEALEAYLDLQEWQATAIAEASAGSKAGEVPIDHERMVAWLTSWGTECELPPPH
jgi:predicted transcriptional regulator